MGCCLRWRRFKLNLRWFYFIAGCLPFWKETHLLSVPLAALFTNCFSFVPFPLFAKVIEYQFPFQPRLYSSQIALCIAIKTQRRALQSTCVQKSETIVSLCLCVLKEGLSFYPINMAWKSHCQRRIHSKARINIKTRACYTVRFQ